MAHEPQATNELLIASVTPQNLERDDLWFSENAAAIKKSRLEHPWWRDNALFLEKDLLMKPSFLVRRLADMGYERAGLAAGKGLFAVQGGIVEVWPVNEARAYAIEFSGNAIAAIHHKERAAIQTKKQLFRSRASLETLAEGSFVVHADHGIGIFRGIAAEYQIKNPIPDLIGDEIRNKSEIQNKKFKTGFGFRASDFGLSIAKNSGEFFAIEYAPPGPGREPDKLFVPADQRNRLTPYVGFETPRIHRLGGTAWLATRRKIKEDAEKLARELLELYAKRHHARRAPYEHTREWQEELRATFAFEETPDQTRAEEEIMADMARVIPMDRILCGDVGFGKTEVAVRASLAAIASGKQVAVLSPTTVLAAQHEKTFSSRFAGLPVRAAMLSRLTPHHDEKRIAREISEGRIDCVIGTHRLFSSDIRFKNLGLVVIDEEQRFGVRQKERFKEMRAEVDVLSLSATPIPRTLSLAMARLRDISMLETPPPERKPVRTMIMPHTRSVIRGAVGQELARGGQVYFLHNRIETIGHAKEKLQKILRSTHPSDRKGVLRAEKHPRIGVIHGRMPEKELIKTMDQFRNREINILLATTIIENGLDISSANTLIVDDAARLGLAQAHQLRGRIGRGTTQAFAYFLYRPKHLTERGAERLEALKEYAELGAGYDIALRDLEIRGAGNILGREQSGAVNKVGLNLYCQMLGEAVEMIRQK